MTGRDGFDPALSAECAELVLGQMAAIGFAGLVIEGVTRGPESADLDRALALKRSRPWSDEEAGTEVAIPWHDQLIDALWRKGHGDTGASGENEGE